MGLLTLKLLGRLGRKTAAARIAIQGFGNVGTHTAKFLSEAECKIVAISDATRWVLSGGWDRCSESAAVRNGTRANSRRLSGRGSDYE